MEARAEDPTRAAEALPDAVRDMDRDELSRLVRQVNDEGTSYQKMADQAEAAGYAVSKPYLQKLATNSVAKAPDPDMLRGIAAGTRRPLTVVQRAAAVQFLDYRATELSGYDDDVRVIVAHLAGMPKGELKRWRRMIEAADNGQDD